MWSPWCETIWPELYRQLTENREPMKAKKETFWDKIIRFFKVKEVSV